MMYYDSKMTLVAFSDYTDNLYEHTDVKVNCFSFPPDAKFKTGFSCFVVGFVLLSFSA